MRRALVAAVGALGLVGVAGLASFAVAAPTGPKTRPLTETLIGAQISASGTKGESVYKASSSLDGTGAGIQDVTVTGTSFPLTGTDTTTTYFANGIAKTKDTFKLGALDANGISAVTGSGKCAGGTGVHKKEKCTYTFTGAYNTKTTVVKAKLTGTDTR